jgi:hypothetical protein
MSRTKRKGNAIAGSFIAHPLELRTSPAWRHLPDNARRVLDRLEVEHMQHGGADNGYLPCTYSDFAKAGLRRQSVALAIRQCNALGFLETTRQGRRSGQEYRTPSLYRLTYLHGCGRSPPPTDDWRKIDTDDAAVEALARANSESELAKAAYAKARKAGVKNDTYQGSKATLPKQVLKGQNRHSSPGVKNDTTIYILGEGGAGSPQRCNGAGYSERKSLVPFGGSAGPSRLAYRSQRETTNDRALRRASKLQARLGNPGGGPSDWPERPKGMRRRTYNRLMDRLDAAQGIMDEHLCLFAARFMDSARRS